MKTGRLTAVDFPPPFVNRCGFVLLPFGDFISKWPFSCVGSGSGRWGSGFLVWISSNKHVHARKKTKHHVTKRLQPPDTATARGTFCCTDVRLQSFDGGAIAEGGLTYPSPSIPHANQPPPFPGGLWVVFQHGPISGQGIALGRSLYSQKM